MKYLFLSLDTYPLFRVDVTKLFGSELRSRGHSIDFVLQSEKKCKKNYKTTWAGGSIWVGANDPGTSTISRCFKQLYRLNNDLKIAALIKKNNYDFVMVKDKFIAAIIALIACKFHQKKFFFWLSYPFPEANLYKSRIREMPYRKIYRFRGILFKYLLYRLIIPAAVHTFVQSEQMKRDIVSQGIDPDHLTPVPMGIQLDDFDLDNMVPLSDLGSQKKIVYLGTLAKVRRMDFLVRVFKHVHDAHPDTKLYFIGGSQDQADMEDLRRYVKNFNIEYAVELTGFLPREKALALAEKADVCVSPILPSPIYNPSSPTKIIEYMALRKAVVANDLPEQKLVIEQSGGGICVSYDEKEFARAIVYLIDHPEEAVAMGQRGRAYVEKHRTYTEIAEKVNKKFKEILGYPSSK